MSQVGVVGALLGGIGLFLLGMWLLTEGLKVAAGAALRTILERWTNSAPRGLVAGFAVTALVQSSSAVTVATIGFVNAGLLTLSQSVWVIYGTNVGTTMTGWLVALVGVQFKVEAFALPLIGVGMALRIIGPGRRSGAWGQALAGFGVFFLGIATLQGAFASWQFLPDLAGLSARGWWGWPALVGAGALLTVLTQSSSAAIAIALTAVAGGAVPFEPAAALVIGANVGTTATALFATIGATPNAKRVAVCHVVFNVLTGVVALLLLPVMLALVDLVTNGLRGGQYAATRLAAFHTVFNLLGVAVMWPLTNRLVRAVSGLYHADAETLARPQFLDANILEVPDLAVQAALHESRRLGSVALRAGRAAASSRPATGEADVVRALAAQINRFIGLMRRESAPPSVALALPDVLRAIQHYQEIGAIADRLGAGAAPPPLPADLADLLGGYRTALLRVLDLADTSRPDFDVDGLEAGWESVEVAYQTLKTALLQATAAGRLEVDVTDAVQGLASAWRRLAYCGMRAALRLQRAAAGRRDAAALPLDAGTVPLPM
jgi:phosphate:Na+ symporter